MLMLTCPYCGPRAETEFTCGGEADIVRPLDGDALTDAQWADYVFMRKNVRGLAREQWQHAHGCRRWFVAERDTVSHAFHGVYPLVSPLVPPLVSPLVPPLTPATGDRP